MRTAWFTESRFGMFVHFGLYSIPAGIWQGQRIRHPYSEWLQASEQIPRAEYRRLAERFDPVGFSADEWIGYAREAGMKYFIVTAKHHDGFALWPSEVSDFNVMNTPFKRDIIGELADSCRRQGIRFGVYYSHWLDWEGTGGDVSVWMENEEYRHPTDEEFEAYWQHKCLPQVRELLTRYDPDLFWFDTWDDPHSLQYVTMHRQQELIDLIRAGSDKAIISSRIQMMDPHSDVDFITCHDNQFPEQGFDKPFETSGTLNESWGHHRLDFAWKRTEQLIRNLMGNASIGGNYQLNVGPDGEGRFSPAAIKRLKELGAWLSANGACLYGTSGGGSIPGGKLTVRGERQYLIIEDGQAEITLPGPTPASASILETGQPVEILSHGTDYSLRVPPEAQGLTLPVAELVF